MKAHRSERTPFIVLKIYLHKKLAILKYRYIAHVMKVVEPSLLSQWEGFPAWGTDRAVVRSEPS